MKKLIPATLIAASLTAFSGYSAASDDYYKVSNFTVQGKIVKVNGSGREATIKAHRLAVQDTFKKGKVRCANFARAPKNQVKIQLTGPVKVYEKDPHFRIAKSNFDCLRKVNN